MFRLQNTGDHSGHIVTARKIIMNVQQAPFFGQVLILSLYVHDYIESLWQHRKAGGVCPILHLRKHRPRE